MKLYGLAGTHGSGKDTIADLLVEKYGFCHISTSDIVREFAQAKYGSIERPVLYKTANELRNTQGYGVLAKMALERYETVKNNYPSGLIVSGLRAMAEAQIVKDASGTIVFVDAPSEVRFQRMNARGREQEAVLSEAEFQAREDAENGGVDPAFNIVAIKDIADLTIFNEGNDIDAFKSGAEKVLGL